MSIDINKKRKKAKALVSQKYEKNDNYYVNISFSQYGKLLLFIDIDTDKFTLDMDDTDELVKEVDNILSKYPSISRSDLIKDMFSTSYTDTEKLAKERYKDYSKMVSSLLYAILIEEYNFRNKTIHNNKQQIYKKYNIE